MLITTTTALALRCPRCGKMDFYVLSLFAFSDIGTRKLQCSCGCQLMSISTRDRKTFCLQLACHLCDSTHIYYPSFKDIWSDEVLTLHCTETDFEVAYIGPREKVKKCVRRQSKSLSELADDVGLENFFDNAPIMYALLDAVHKINEKGKLFCQCGNHNIEIEIFPGHVELHCAYCKAGGILYGRSYEDAERIKAIREIELTTNGFRYHRPKNNRKRHSKK